MGQTSFAVAFLGGLAALFSPCAAMLLPSFFAFAFTRTGTMVGRLLLFLVGLLAAMVPLGLAAGSLGQVLLADTATMLRIGAVLLLVLGLVTAAGLSLPMPGLSRSGRGDPATPLAILALGASYGLASGCTGPILGSVLTVAAMGGSPVLAGAMMAVYALGMALPLVLVSLLWERLRLGERNWFKPRPVTLGPVHTTLTQLVSGLVFAALGLFLLVTGGQAGGLLDATTQYRLENRLAAWGRAVGNIPVLVLVVLLVGGLTWLWLAERERAAR
ncbi:MAG: sulfite exporter TauE/SafE family protein [Luteococcus sp.]|uniref:cytochrome c biogenesis CcdA family protein n=1 Tax=Luteococcus sp. TaxID=1969402 RepID=UPI002647B65B|nr:cytochrome c biogenesis protein CcdA [Luteococcus sp.]MDN5563385.1 sulfite exporter TauE/SafE family protein [Luteococcus sp.]